MAIAFGAIGAKTITGTTTVSIAHPTGTAADNILLAGRCGWYSDIVLVNEPGWENTTRHPGGNNGAAADTHTTEIGVDHFILSGALAGPTVFDQTGGTQPGIVGIMARYSKAAGVAWEVRAAFGTDDTHAANRSVAAAGNLILAVGDMVVVFVATDTDTSLAGFATPAITAPGITFGATTRRSPASAGSIQGHDGNIEVFDALVTAGTASVAITLTFTTTTAQCGPAAFIVLREVTLPVVDEHPHMAPRIPS